MFTIRTTGGLIFGCVGLEVRCWMPEARYWLQAAQYWILKSNWYGAKEALNIWGVTQ
jgi:hypothetical protein